MQTSYNLECNAAFDGMIADSGFTRTESAIAEETDGIPFGYGVVQGTAENQVKLPDADTETFRGIAGHEHNDDGEYANGEPVNVVRKAVIWVPVADAVVLNASAYIVASGATAGQFTDSSSGTIATGGKFRSSTSAAGRAKVEINLP